MTNIVRLLRISNEVNKQYATLRIEELKRDYEECQKVKNVLLEALEEVVALTENLQVCPFCGCVLDHRPDCLSREIEATVRKARG